MNLDRLRAANVRYALSVLYQPFAEFDFGKWPSGMPESGYFQALTDQLTAVEDDLAAKDPDARLHVVVKSTDDLSRVKRGEVTGFFHCVEGGFHLGKDENEVRDRVDALADAGVVYVTLAHLFFRRIAKNAPALPFLKDWQYKLLFWQWWSPGGLTNLGRAAVEEMYERYVLVDISHMRQDAIDATFDLIETLDKAHPERQPSDYPVIATHGGFRFGKQSYNLTPETVKRIADRGGLVGLILSQHLMNDGLRDSETDTLGESMQVLKSHIDALEHHGGGWDHIAFGTDLDGFIKPTLAGFEHADDLGQLPEQLGALYPTEPEVVEKILSTNAERVLDTVFAQREAAVSA